MPSSGVTARRYAQAAFELAQESDSVDRWQSDLHMLAEVFSDSSVAYYFNNPRASNPEKAEAAGKMFEGRVLPETLNLVRMLVARHRADVVGRISERFDELYRDAQGIITAQVTTAIEIDNEERSKIAEQLGKMTGKTVEVESVVDPSIIGGLIAQIGDQLIDGSVITSLRQLRARLS